MGRLSEFDPAVAAKVCEEVSTGKSLRQTCREMGLAESTIRSWYLDDVQDFGAQYARARELQMESWADEITEISDDGSNDWMTIKRGGEEVEVENKEVLNRSRLRVDTRKWLMSKIAPKKYAERIAHAGADGVGPVQVQWLSPDAPPKP